MWAFDLLAAALFWGVWLVKPSTIHVGQLWDLIGVGIGVVAVLAIGAAVLSRPLLRKIDARRVTTVGINVFTVSMLCMGTAAFAFGDEILDWILLAIFVPLPILATIYGWVATALRRRAESASATP